MALFWHRRDLRAVDNRGVQRAAAAGPPLPVFVLDPGVLDHAGPPRVAFLLDALGSLRARYHELGGDLVLVVGDPTEVLPRLVAEAGHDRVVWNADHTGLAWRRDGRPTPRPAPAGSPEAGHAEKPAARRPETAG